MKYIHIQMTVFQKILAIVLFTLIIIFIMVANPFKPQPAQPTEQIQAQPTHVKAYTVTYEVTGTDGIAEIAYINSFGKLENIVQQLPFNKSYIMFDGDRVYIAAGVNETETLNCRILVDSVELVRSTENSLSVACTGVLGQ